MLDPKIIRTDPEAVRQALVNRNHPTGKLDEFLTLDEKRRKLLTEVEAMKAERNRISDEIAVMKRNKEDASEIIKEMQAFSSKIKALDNEVRDMDQEFTDILLNIPNIPDASVPVGRDETENVIVRSWGEPRRFDFEPRPHWDICTALDMLDFERGAKISGAGFIVYKGAGSRLERSLFSWMLDFHTRKHGYTEIFPPFLVNAGSMTGTGQLPKFEEDMYKCDKGDELYNIPTAEVPVTNLYSGEILPGELLPVKHCAYSACFRREAGSAGKDTRGLLRVHQFNKVELVQFVRPEDSPAAHESLTGDAEDILRALNIPYRVVALCTGDISFSCAKCYDLEIYAPGADKWLEVSSCSNFKDYQARRAGIRFRREKGAKPEYVHTLNGSGVALPWLYAAIIENYQRPDGSVEIPEALRHYMGCDELRPE
ncbi:MAG: serine--tRNA ligase [Abditibacteriota bacterium]|nr:serine--tRNA ligase [Abditibacteriota bacterium]